MEGWMSARMDDGMSGILAAFHSSIPAPSTKVSKLLES